MDYVSKYYEIQTWEPIAIFIASFVIIAAYYHFKMISKSEIIDWFFRMVFNFAFIAFVIHGSLILYDNYTYEPHAILAPTSSN